MFDSILDKIKNAPILSDPFCHIEIKNLLPSDIFEQIVSSPEISFDLMNDDRELVTTLGENGWRPIPFPGTTENVDTYLQWRQKGGKVLNNNTCEGFGITYRLFNAKSPILLELMKFLEGDDFKNALTDRFGIPTDGLIYDAGIQKYLDGYEISPHPDIRRKALTYMVNINPSAESEKLKYHTHYMRFLPEKEYIQSYWKHNMSSERCWVPWNWCTTVKQQTMNNSMVVFSPNHETLHAVRAQYDHLQTQRTQLYGNFWYGNKDSISLSPEWENYVISESSTAALKRQIPDFIKKPLKILAGRGSLNAGKRSVRT